MKSPPWVDFHSNGRQAFIGFDVWQAVARKKKSTSKHGLLLPSTEPTNKLSTYTWCVRAVYTYCVPYTWFQNWKIFFFFFYYYYILSLSFPSPPYSLPTLLRRSFRDCAHTTEIHYRCRARRTLLYYAERIAITRTYFTIRRSPQSNGTRSDQQRREK